MATEDRFTTVRFVSEGTDRPDGIDLFPVVSRLVSRLPESVRHWVMDDVWFAAHHGGVESLSIPANGADRINVVVIGDETPAERLPITIARELARLYLAESSSQLSPVELAEQWGVL